MEVDRDQERSGPLADGVSVVGRNHGLPWELLDERDGLLEGADLVVPVGLSKDLLFDRSSAYCLPTG